MFEAILKLLNKDNRSSSQIARDRLKIVLIHDRANITPEMMQCIKNDIIEVLSRYMEINRNGAEVCLENDADSVALLASVPISRVKSFRKAKQGINQ